MSNHKTDQELLSLLTPHRAHIGRFVDHLSTGNRYMVTGVHLQEADLSPHFVYGRLTSSHEWVSFSRPLEELISERFGLGSFPTSIEHLYATRALEVLSPIWGSPQAHEILLVLEKANLAITRKL